MLMLTVRDQHNAMQGRSYTMCKYTGKRINSRRAKRTAKNSSILFVLGSFLGNFKWLLEEYYNFLTF